MAGCPWLPIAADASDVNVALNLGAQDAELTLPGPSRVLVATRLEREGERLPSSFCPRGSEGLLALADRDL